MKIIIQSDTGATLDIVHVPDGDLDDCTAMMNLESRMLDARMGLRIVESTGLVPLETWLRDQRDKSKEHGFILVPVKPCEICGGSTGDGNYCEGCHDQLRDLEKTDETEERKTRWQTAKKRLAKVFGIGHLS